MAACKPGGAAARPAREWLAASTKEVVPALEREQNLAPEEQAVVWQQQAEEEA